mmetsp:Transcript_24442/g.37906  ORF Transcript_24442/g.37906 Transcript_24442/m.37906 type:complete len:82 (+) Transcript_24442:1211-1456(+)
MEQQEIQFKEEGDPEEETKDETDDQQKKNEHGPDHSVLLSGIENNSLRRINPIYNSSFDKVSIAKEYFTNKVKALREAGKL